MKAAILSMQQVVNMGSVLQAYSLRELVRSVTGEPVDFLDITDVPAVESRKSIKEADDYTAPAAYPPGIFQRGKRRLIAVLSRQTKRKIRAFMESELHLSGNAGEKQYDCVIVGRCGDYILKKMNPIRLFVYADMESKFLRCREMADEHEHLSDKELRKMIRRIDHNRAKYYRYYTGHVWGERTNYDMCINTSNVPLEELSEALAHLFK